MCVRDACSLTETTQRHVQRGEQIDHLPSSCRHRLQVRQTVCLRLLWCGSCLRRALWRRGWVHTSVVADITGRKTFTHLTSDVAKDATSTKLVENVRQERVSVVTRCAAAQDVLSGEATKRVGQCRCGWFPCACSSISRWRDWPPRECACVIVVVSLCVFPQCHRWEAGHQERHRFGP